MLTLGEISTWMKKLNNWSLELNSINKEFEFKEFKESIAFVNKIAEIAEQQNHHPGIIINYGKVRINLTTHHEKALTEKDFQLAEAIDKLYG